jgi:hypothetical protein
VCNAACIIAHSIICTVFTVLHTVSFVQCTLYCTQYPLYSVQYTAHSIICTVYTVHSTSNTVCNAAVIIEHSIICTVYTVLHTVSFVQCVLYCTQYHLYTVHCTNNTLCNAACILAHSIIWTRLFREKMHSDSFNGIDMLQVRWQNGEKVGYCFSSGLEKTLFKWDIYIPLVTKVLNYMATCL